MGGWSPGGWPAFLPRSDGTRRVKPGHRSARFAEVVVSPFPCYGPSLQQSLSIIVADMGRWRWCAPRAGKQGAGRKIITAPRNQSWQLWVYFHVILFTWNLHYTCECMLYLFVVRNPCLKEKGKKPIYLVLFTNVGRVAVITGCWDHLHTQWCNISLSFHQEPLSCSNK